MKTILIPTDFSKNAYSALQYAVDLLKNQECTFCLLNAYHTQTDQLSFTGNPETETQSLQQIAKRASERALQQTLQKIESENRHPNHSFKTVAISGSLLNAIDRAVLDHDIHCIIMGTQGATGLKRVFLGSNTVEVINKIDFCPVVAVPPNYTFTVPKEILFVTGFEHVYNNYELNPMIRIAELWNSRVRVLHLKEKDEYPAHKETAKKVISKRLHHISHEVTEQKKKGKVSVEIEKTITENNNIGLVAMIHYWHSFIEKLTHEPVIEKVAFQCKIPFLVMHLPE